MEFIRHLLDDIAGYTPAQKTWIVIGFLGQLLFFGRFFVQWLASEKQKRVVVPLAFWVLSILGGLTLFSYAVHKRDPVFMAGHLLALCIYFRNVYLHLRHEETREMVG